MSSATTLIFLAQASRMAPAPVRPDMASTTSALPLTSPSVTARPAAGSFDLFEYATVTWTSGLASTAPLR